MKSINSSSGLVPFVYAIGYDFSGSRPSEFFLELESQLLDRLVGSYSGKSSPLPLIALLWQSRSEAVVLGISQQIEQELNLARCQDLQIDILRRRSGGGAVYHGQGNICYSIIMPTWLQPELARIDQSFVFIGQILVQSLRAFDVPAIFMPLSDVAIQRVEDQSAKKISGNAQYRRRGYLLQHGTILFDVNLEKIESILSEPSKQPEYRQHRKHRDFLTSLTDSGYVIDKFNFAARFLRQVTISYQRIATLSNTVGWDVLKQSLLKMESKNSGCLMESGLDAKTNFYSDFEHLGIDFELLFESIANQDLSHWFAIS